MLNINKKLNMQYIVLTNKDRTGCVEATQQDIFGLGQLSKIGTQERLLYLNIFQVIRGAVLPPTTAHHFQNKVHKHKMENVRTQFWSTTFSLITDTTEVKETGCRVVVAGNVVKAIC